MGSEHRCAFPAHICFALGHSPAEPAFGELRFAGACVASSGDAVELCSVAEQKIERAGGTHGPAEPVYSALLLEATETFSTQSDAWLRTDGVTQPASKLAFLGHFSFTLYANFERPVRSYGTR